MTVFQMCIRDRYRQCLLMEDGLRIPLGELYDMDGRIFNGTFFT